MRRSQHRDEVARLGNDGLSTPAENATRDARRSGSTSRSRSRCSVSSGVTTMIRLCERQFGTHNHHVGRCSFKAFGAVVAAIRRQPGSCTGRALDAEPASARPDGQRRWNCREMRRSNGISGGGDSVRFCAPRQVAVIVDADQRQHRDSSRFIRISSWRRWSRSASGGGRCRRKFGIPQKRLLREEQAEAIVLRPVRGAGPVRGSMPIRRIAGRTASTDLVCQRRLLCLLRTIFVRTRIEVRVSRSASRPSGLKGIEGDVRSSTGGHVPGVDRRLGDSTHPGVWRDCAAGLFCETPTLSRSAIRHETPPVC